MPCTITPPTQPVAPASLPISDDMLAAMRDQAYAIFREETLSASEALTLLHALGPLLDELLQHRAALGVIRTLSGGSNVIPLRGFVS